MKRIKYKNYEYDLETTQKGMNFENLKIPKGAEMWTAKDVLELINKFDRKKLNLVEDLFFIKSYLKEFEVGRLSASPDWFSVYCNGDPQFSDSALGVRFKWLNKNQRLKGKVNVWNKT